LDHSEPQAHKNEPSLDPAAAFSTAPPPGAVQPRAPDTGEMPAWLSQTPVVETAGQRWGRRIKFLGIALATVAIAGGATKIGLDLAESNDTPPVVAGGAQPEVGVQSAPPAQPAVLEPRGSALPPLVMAPPDPSHKKDTAAPAATLAAGQVPVPVPAPVPVPVAPVKAVTAEPAPPKVVTAPAPLVAKKLENAPQAAIKPAKVAAPAPKAVASATPAVAKPKPKLVAVKKPLPPKHLASAPAKPRPIKGTMLPPPRERGLDPAFQPPMREAVDRRCRAGELARECAERIR
jgi:hypothetical protein